MKKIICLVLIFTMMLTACSKWEVEIVDPTKPVENEQELVIREDESGIESEESEHIQEEPEDGEPVPEEFFIMKICEGEEQSESDFIPLSDGEAAQVHSALDFENWVEVPEDWKGKGSLSSPVNILQNAPRECMYVSTDGENTLITIKWGAKQENIKYYHAPQKVAAEIEELRVEFAKKVASEEIEPKIEDFNTISIYSEDDISISHEFSKEEYAEWVSLVNLDKWEEYHPETESGSISNGVTLFTPSKMFMFMGYDVNGNETALIKYGRNRNLGKMYLLPEETLSAAEEFQKRMVKENPNVFTYPECNYDMSAKAFLNRENDDYILYLDELLSCCNWNAAKEDYSLPYLGYKSSSELNSKIVFNVFMFTFNYCGTEYKDNLTKAAWYDSSDEKYHIPMGEIYAVLSKYISGFSLDMEETSVNYEFDENGILSIYGGYGITSFRKEKGKVVSVTDNGDGTITAVVESHVYHIDDNDDMYLSEKPEIRNTMVLSPDTFRCVILSHKIEKIGD